MGKFCTMEAHARAVEILKLWKRPVLPPFAYSFQYFSPLRVSSLSILLWTKRNILPVLSLMTLHSLPRFHFTSVWVMIFTFPGNLKMILSQFLHRLGQRQMHGGPQYTCAEWMNKWETGMGGLIATTWVQVFASWTSLNLPTASHLMSMWVIIWVLPKPLSFHLILIRKMYFLEKLEKIV